MSTFSYIQSYRFVSVAKKLIQRIMNNVSSFIVSMYVLLLYVQYVCTSNLSPETEYGVPSTFAMT